MNLLGKFRQLRVLFGVVLAIVALESSALAQSAVDWPRMDSFVPNPNGQENLLVDFAIMPNSYYQLDPFGHPIDGIRLAAWANLATRSYLDGKLRVVASFRYDLDGGSVFTKAGDNNLLTPNSYSLLAAYIEYDATNDLHLRVGRQTYADLADYLSFDGGRVMWKLPGIPIQLEAYGGVRSSLAVTQGVVGSSLYELDGTAQSELQGTQPVVGAAIRWVGDLRNRGEASVGFRESWRLYNPNDAILVGGAIPQGAEVTAQELVASAARDLGVFYLAGGAAYDLGLLRLMRARASLVFPFSKFVPIPFLGYKRQLDFSLDYQRYQPSFALDSIWNYFTNYPFDEGAVGFVLHGGPVRLEARVFERVYYAEIYDDTNQVLTYSPGIQYAAGGRASAAWSATASDLFDGGASYQAGFGGGELLVDAGLRHRFELPLEVYGRLSVSNWNETLITTNDGSSVGAVVGATYHLPFGASVAIIAEEAVVVEGTAPVNGVTPTNFTSVVPRIYAVLDLTRWL